jgi:hypothetical protein
MSADDPRYADINNIRWPPCSRVEAATAAGQLVRHFGKVSLAPAELRGHDMRRLPYDVPRRCWISRTPTVGVSKGWPRLLHDVSHAIHRYRHPSQRPHGPSHAAIEREVALFAILKGWDTGKLAPKRKAKPTKDQKLAALDVRMARWESKVRRAQNAMKKLRRQRAALVRAMAKVQP